MLRWHIYINSVNIYLYSRPEEQAGWCGFGRFEQQKEDDELNNSRQLLYCFDIILILFLVEDADQLRRALPRMRAADARHARFRRQRGGI